MNILLITLDQFRGDCLSSAGHPLVQTPNLDALAEGGVRLARHFSQATPCAPGRACLYTGTYQMNNRVVANGTPLDDRFDNVARAGRRAGYAPALFGYTDQGIDPRVASGPDDPGLSDYEGVLPGFDAVLDLAGYMRPWLDWVRSQGHDVPNDIEGVLASSGERPAEVSISHFLTDRALAWIDDQTVPWFAHLSYLRPHPPYAAAGHWAERYDPADVDLPIEARPAHPLHEFAMSHDLAGAPTDEAAMRHLRAQYYGMIGEVDEQLGRLWAGLRDREQWDDTFVVVTADHGEQLGDHGLREKLGYFPQSHHVVGIVRDPRHPEAHGTVVDRFTENVDVFPTLCDAMGLDVPAQVDGLPLTPFLQGEAPPWWRDAAHWEYDWRGQLIGDEAAPWPWDRMLERQHLAVLCREDVAYVQFGNGTWLCFDLVEDPTWRTTVDDPAVVLPLAQEMLTWRSQHADRTLSDMLLERGGIGRWPVLPDGWGVKPAAASTSPP
ncbi:MAG TPA: sulfatase-like hydrolase/transferase [Acidimicrobiales bacterium]|nr:sulfatase-like hydrolase/transferase [Acidimicrobiales bacterium]